MELFTSCEEAITDFKTRIYAHSIADENNNV